MKNILITGANGYIGSHVVELAVSCLDLNVFAVDFKNNYINPKATFINYDILQHAEDENLYNILGQPDIIVHLAWKDGFNHNADSHINMLPNHYHFLKNMIDHGCLHIAVAGSFREYGSCGGKVSEDAPVIISNNYSWAKISLKNLLEIYLQNKKVCFQWLRFFTPYGDDEQNNSILSKILQWEIEGKKTFPFTDGTEQYDYIHINDLAEQILSAVRQNKISGVINCCSGKPTALKTVIEMFLQEHNLKIRPEYGAFPHRAYDSDIIYGDNSKIKKIMTEIDK